MLFVRLKTITYYIIITFIVFIILLLTSSHKTYASVQFDGTDDYIDYGAAGAAKPTGTITFETWFKWNGSASTQYILSSGGQTSSTGIYIDLNDTSVGTSPNNISVGIRTGTKSVNYGSASNVIGTGKWYHIAASYDDSAGILSVYLDGELLGTATAVNAAYSNVYGTFVIGNVNSGGTYYFNGKVSDVRIWSTARSQSRIKQFMHKTLYGTEGGLVGYWKLNEDAGTASYDSSVTKKNGTLMNGPVWNTIDNPPAYFTRNSSAVNLDGTTASTNTPRYTTGRNGQGILLEESTTNLLSAGWSTAESNAGSYGVNCLSTLSISSAEHWEESNSLRIDTDGAFNNQGFYVWSSVLPSTTYTYSMWLKGTGDIQLGFNGANFASPQFSPIYTLTNTWKNYSFTVTTPSSVSANMNCLVVTASKQAVTFYADGLQLEKKHYATSWIIGGGTREAENLTVPAGGLFSPQQNGTVEFWWKPTNSKLVPASANTSDPNYWQYVSPMLIQIGSYASNGSVSLWAIRASDSEPALSLYIKGASSGSWSRTETVKDYGSGWYDTDNYHHFAISWSNGTSFKVYMDGALIGGPYTVADPVTTWASNTIWLGGAGAGHSSSGTTQCNIDDFHAYNTTLSDSEIASAYSTGAVAKGSTLNLEFDGSLNPTYNPDVNITSPYSLNQPLTAAMLSQSGLTSFDAVRCVDNIANGAWHTDTSAAGAYFEVDLGAGNAQNIIGAGIQALSSGYKGNYTIQYSDDNAAWTDAAANFVPNLAGWNSKYWITVGVHRYWRLYLANTPGSGPWLQELRLYKQQDQAFTALTSGMLSQSGLTEFYPVMCVDDVKNCAWHTDASAAGAYLKVDLGAGNEKAFTGIGVQAYISNYYGNYSIQYSDDDSIWTDASANFVPSLAGWNSKYWAAAGAHRYWRLLLTNTPGPGSWLSELKLFTTPPVYLQGNQLELNWAGQTPNATSLTYTIEIGNSYGLKNKINTSTGLAPWYIVNLDGTWSGTYYWRVIAVDDKGGQTVSEEGIFIVNNPPVITLTSPASNQSYSAISVYNIITLSGKVYDPNGNDVTISAVIDGKTKTTTVSSAPTSIPGADNWTLTWDVSADSLNAGSYTNIVITADDGQGGNGTTTFTNTITVDKTAPAVSGTTPANNTNNNTITSAITVTFNEPIASSTAYNAITLKDASNNNIEVVKSISGNTLTLTPSAGLVEGTTYEVTIPASAVKDLAGNDIAVQSSFVFATNVASGNDIKVLMHFDGTNASTTFTDETGKTWTGYGSAQISTAQSKFGGSSVYFDGSSYITTPDSADFSLGSGDFTIDCWIYPTDVTGTHDIIEQSAVPGDSNAGLALRIIDGKITGFMKKADLTAFPAEYYGAAVGYGTIEANKWTHVAFVRNGSTFYLFVNGTKVAEAVSAEAEGDWTAPLSIGRHDQAVFYYNGYIDEMRLTKGAARWTSDFTLPSQPYGYTSTLLHFDGANGSTTFTDETGKTWTSYANAQISTAQSKFGGSSAYFDGTSYINTPDSTDFDLGSGSFTADAWIYPTDVTGYKEILSQSITPGSGTAGLILRIIDGKLCAIIRRDDAAALPAETTYGTIAANQWSHISFVRDGAKFFVFINGEKAGGGTSTDAQGSCTGPLNIGKHDFNGYYYLGYIDEIRLVKGAAIYPSNFDNSKVANWKLDETSGTTVNDSAGVYTGTAAGTTIIDGYSGKARSFDGSTSGITFTSKVIPLGAKTIRFKMRTTTTNTGVILANMGNYTTEHGDFIYITVDGKVVWESSQASATTRFYIVSSQAVNDGNWHDVTLSWDGTTGANTVKMYIDNVLSVQGTANSIETTEQTLNLSIGRYLNFENDKYAGDLDEIEIYNYPINPPDITLTSPSADQEYSAVAGHDTITFSGKVYDSDADEVTLSATINGVTKTTTVNPAPSTDPGADNWILTWDIVSDNIAEGSYTNITITADDGSGGIASADYSNTITVDKIAPDVPTNITLTPQGGTVVPDTLNGTNTKLIASADITAGQAAGGYAELLIDGVVKASDTTIEAGDTTVTFDATPNLLTYSEEFDNSDWDNNSTITANAATAPDGTLTADKLVENAVNDYHVVTRDILTAIADNQTVTFSVYVKKINRPYFMLQIQTKDGGNWPCAEFNLDAANVTNLSDGYTASIIPAGNGYFKCSFSGSIGSGSTTPILYIKLLDDSENEIYLGDGTSGLYIWGAQLELSSSSTLYQHTSTGNAAVELQSVITSGGEVSVRLYDAAGNSITSSTGNPTLTVNYIPDAPANITLIPQGGTVVTDTLNGTNTKLTASADITAGQATGGHAELLIDGVVKASDTKIEAGDTTVTFDAAPNLFPYSEEFDNAVWEKSLATISANADTAPDGSLTADKLIEDTTNGHHEIAMDFPAAIADNENITLSIYIKKAERSIFMIDLYTKSGDWNSAVFDLNEEAVIFVNSGYTAAITPSQNGYYRCSMTGSIQSGVETPVVYFRLVNDSYTDTYIGDGASGMYIWGAQLELGSSATLYQHTTTGGAAAELQSAITSGGEVLVRLYDSIGNSVTSSIGNPNLILDYTIPTLTGVTIASNNLNTTAKAKVGDTITLSITSNESIQTPAVTIAGHNALVSGSGTNWTASYTMAEGDTEGTVAFNISFSDIAGNAGTDVTAATNSSSVAFDKTAPTVSIGAPSASTTTNGPENYSITYTGADTVNLTEANITLNKTGTADGAVTVSNGTTTTPTVSITSITGDGTLGITILPGTSTDTVGNTDTGAGPGITFNVDNNSPTVTLTHNHGDTVVKDSDTITITAVFTDNMSATPTVSIDVYDADADITNATMTGAGTTWTYTWNVPSAHDGTAAITIAGTDTAGNPYTGAASLTFDIDNTAPVITLNGTTPITIERGNSYTDEGAQASDTHDGNLTGLITTGGAVDTNATGTYTITYDVTDTAGNPAVQVTRTVEVVDTTGPAAPTATPAGGAYSTSQTVTITPPADAAHTYYTLDGTDPNNTSSTEYTVAISVYGNDGETVTLKAVSYDADSNRGAVLTQDYTFDTTSPTIDTANVTDGQTDVAVNQPITIIFPENIYPGTAFTDITVSTAVYDEVYGTQYIQVPITINITGNTLTITPDTQLDQTTTYTVEIPAGAVKDEAGNNLPTDQDYTFTTGDFTAPTITEVIPGETYNSAVTPTFTEGTATLNGQPYTSGTPITQNGTYTLAVTDTSGNTTTVTFTIDIPSNNANLAGMTTSAGILSPVFSPAQTTYTMTVSSSTSAITVTPTAQDANAQIRVNGVATPSGSQSHTITLITGTNTITVQLTAEDAVTTKTYTITVTKQASTSSTPYIPPPPPPVIQPEPDPSTPIVPPVTIDQTEPEVPEVIQPEQQPEQQEEQVQQPQQEEQEQAQQLEQQKETNTEQQNKEKEMEKIIEQVLNSQTYIPDFSNTTQETQNNIQNPQTNNNQAQTQTGGEGYQPQQSQSNRQGINTSGTPTANRTEEEKKQGKIALTEEEQKKRTKKVITTVAVGVAIATGAMGAAAGAGAAGVAGVAGAAAAAGTAGAAVGTGTAATTAAGTTLIGNVMSTATSTTFDITRSAVGWIRRIKKYRKRVLYKNYRRAEKLKRGLTVDIDSIGEINEKQLRKSRFTFVRINTDISRLFEQTSEEKNQTMIEELAQTIERITKKLAVSLKIDLDHEAIEKDEEYQRTILRQVESLAGYLNKYNASRLFIEIPYIPEITDKLIRAVRKGMPKHTIVLSGIEINKLLGMPRPKDRNMIYGYNITESKVEIPRMKIVLKGIYRWSNTNKVPVIAEINSFENKKWLKSLRIMLKRYVMGWILPDGLEKLDAITAKVLKLKKL